MALSMDEQRMLAEIERRLADDDPVLAARLTTFRLPRLTLATRSARSRLMTSLLMLVVVGVVAVFVYALMPFGGQATPRVNGIHVTASHSTAVTGRPAHANARAAGSPGASRGGKAARTPAQQGGPAPGRSGPSSAYGK
jgi:hypothetical protein